ncbi:MAG: hypothetical protein R2807_09965 [Chitinophagales bacterium]
MEASALPTITVEQTTVSKLPSIDFNNLAFGKHSQTTCLFVNTMMENGKQQNSTVSKFIFINVCNVFHYGQAIFEGMKAYYKEDGSGVAYLDRKKCRTFEYIC